MGATILGILLRVEPRDTVLTVVIADVVEVSEADLRTF